MDYPGNSYNQVPRTEPQKPKQEAKKVEKVIQGAAVRRKKSLGKRFREFYFSRNAKDAWGSMLTDSLIPGTKDVIVDFLQQTIEVIFLGEGRSLHRRRMLRSGPYGNFDYTRPSRTTMLRDPRHEESRGISRRARISQDFDEIVLESRVEAEEVIDNLFELVSRFNVATVADLYDLVGIESNYIDRKWGWEDLRGAGATRVKGGGYLLDLPRPEPLE
jgi:hypothetical protein